MYGKATGDDLDLDKQIIDKDFAREAIGKWLATGGNVRQMHATTMPPAGKGLLVEEKDDGFYVKSRIVEPTAKLLALEGVYEAYSVGISQPRIVRDLEAENGRIVGGIMSELSLVDRPANPTCKAMVVKRAEDGELEDLGGVETIKTAMTSLAAEAETEPVEKAAPADDDDDDDNTDADDQGDSSDNNDDGGDDDEQKLEKKELSSDERGALNDSDFAYVDAKGERHLPIHDKAHVRAALGRFGQTQFDSAADRKKAAGKIIARAKKFAIDVADDSAVAEAAKVAAPFTVKRLHDACCCAYGWDEVVKAYPTLEKNGLAATLGPSAVSLLYQMLANEVREDGGSGGDALDIKSVAHAYASLCEFLASEMAEQDMDAVYAEARATLHKMFADLYPDVSLSLADPPAPGSFRRPYLTDGRQARVAAGGDKTRTPVNVPEPEDFDRGFLQDGRQQEPKSTAAEAELAKAGDDRGRVGVGARTFYTNAARDQAAASMRAIHDSLASMYPDVCPMGKVGDQSPDPQVGAVHEGTAAQTIYVNAGARPQLVNTDGYVRTSLDPELVKAAIHEAAGAELDELRQAIKHRDDQISELTDTVAKLASAPDPHRAPVRGSGKVLQETAIEEPDPARGMLQKRIDYLQTLTTSPNPDLRLRAQTELAKLAAGA